MSSGVKVAVVTGSNKGIGFAICLMRNISSPTFTFSHLGPTARTFAQAIYSSLFSGIILFESAITLDFNC